MSMCSNKKITRSNQMSHTNWGYHMVLLDGSTNSKSYSTHLLSNKEKCDLLQNF